MDPLVAVAITAVALTGLPYAAYGGLYLALRPSGAPVPKDRETEPSVSIVLPTYDEERIVEAKLDDLRALDYPSAKQEWVVVDASADRTPDVVREYVAAHDDAPQLTLLEEDERRGLAPALNDAYDAASGDVIVKTDCDSRLATDALREAVATLAHPDVAAVTGRNADSLGSEVEAGYRGVQARIQTLESHLDSTLIFHGPFSAFASDAIVPIDADSLADDSELALKIRRGGGRAVFDPAIRYAEAAHSAFRARRQQKDRRATGLVRLLWRHRDALGRYGRFGRIVLPFNWWFMVVSPPLVALDIVLVTAVALLLFGPAGLAAPVALGAGIWLGSRDALGPFQAVYAVFDTQVSLLGGLIAALRGQDGTWEVDADLREAYE